MQAQDPRQALESLVRERKDEYAALSRLIGRNETYIQQYVKRGVPRRLAEADRRTLARYFGVDEIMLGAPPPDDPPTGPIEPPSLDAFSIHEVLHTASIIGDMFERHIVQHRLTRSDPELAAAADKIGEALADFYQLIGRRG